MIFVQDVFDDLKQFSKLYEFLFFKEYIGKIIVSYYNKECLNDTKKFFKDCVIENDFAIVKVDRPYYCSYDETIKDERVCPICKNEIIRFKNNIYICRKCDTKVNFTASFPRW